MENIDKLGAFYLGKRVETESDALTDDPVLYDSKDLTTHAVIIGMTGSGKTGLGVGMLEEAALDGVPVIAIDPKGDMGNLALSFPRLRAEDFAPWVDARAATEKGQSPAEYAAAQAATWKKGLADWGQDGKRIKAFRNAADVSIYTPGSNAGLPVSLLQSFAAPAAALIEDSDLYRERIQSTATGILALLGIDADPIASREHILIARILDDAWQNGRDVDVARLIMAIQDPPFSKVGVMPLDAYFPAKDRHALATRLNNLLASPGFEAWMQGEPLDAARLLHTQAGKPRISVMSIAHLGESERMYFVCMLLNEIIGWMRTQPGTSSLRAILYMDEIFGYLPPVANPPSKALFLTLLKQARAYGVGLVLATQNPVDLDYKALSNAGTWFIGRLQTEQDKARVIDGLEGAGDDEFDRAETGRTISGLGKRRFYLHNVHEDEPVVFGTRWVLSYLAGPLTRDQVGTLMASAKKTAETRGHAIKPPSRSTASAPLALPASVPQFFLDAQGDDIVYHPRLIGAGDIVFSNARYDVNDERVVLYATEFEDAPVTIDWDAAEPLDVTLDDLNDAGSDAARFAELPEAAAEPKSYARWERDFKRWLRQNETLTLYRNKRLRMRSEPGETEGEFRARLKLAASEKRDLAVAKLRKRYATKVTTLENRLMRANQAIEREQQQANKKKLDTAISFGTAILGAVLGRKRLSSSTASKMGTAMRSAGSAQKEAGDVERARVTADKVRRDLAELNASLEKEVADLDSGIGVMDEELDEIVVRAKSTDIHVPALGIVWMPFAADEKGRLRPCW